jgi:Holliday junction resolvase RusA-like endonuclease
MNILADELNLVIDNSVIAEYENHYFAEHPRAKKPPIDAPYHPSINKWMIMKRPMMNALKQKWKDFVVWFIKYVGYENLSIDECEMVFTTYFKTKIRHDVDNCVPKFILDGLVDSGFIKDDDSKHLKSLTMKCEYDKDCPRTEIVVKILKGEIPKTNKRRVKHG